MTKLCARKVNRLKDYDYSQNGAYYITIYVNNKLELLSNIDVGANCVRLQLSEIGQIIANEIDVMSSTYVAAFIDKYVIMPNHIHMIIIISMDGRTQFAPTIPRIIKQFKGPVIKQIGHSIWQKSFYDHVIRNEDDY